MAIQAAPIGAQPIVIGTAIRLRPSQPSPGARPARWRTGHRPSSAVCYLVLSVPEAIDDARRGSAMTSRLAIGTATVALLCGACSGSTDGAADPTPSTADNASLSNAASAPAETQPSDASGTTTAAPSTQSGRTSQMVNPDFFGPDEWSAQLPAETRVLVWSDRVLYLTEDTVTALDANGSEVWSTDTHVNDGQPVLADAEEVRFRAVSQEAVAVLRPDSKIELSGDADTGTRIAVLDIDNGDTAGPVEVVGGVGAVGIAAGRLAGWSTPLASTPTETVTPDGTHEIHPSETVELSGLEVDSAPTMVVGDLVVNGLRSPSSDGLRSDGLIGFSTDAWTSLDLAPEGYDPTVAVPLATDAIRVLAVDWWGNGEAGPRFTLIDVTEGQTIAAVPCGGFENGLGESGVLSTSPDGRYLVHGRLMVDLETGDHRCVDLGGSGSPEFQAVGDAGWSYTWARDSNDDKVMVASRVDGEDVVSPATDQMQLPIGMLGNGLAVHYDEASGAVSANPVLSDLGGGPTAGDEQPPRESATESSPPPAASPELCGAVPTANSAVYVEIVRGQVTCDDARTLLDTYYNDPPEPPGGSGGFVQIGEWGCISASAAEVEETSRVTTCRGSSGAEIVTWAEEPAAP